MSKHGHGGRVLMAVGLGMLLCAGGLIGRNYLEERQAGASVQAVAEQLRGELHEAQAELAMKPALPFLPDEEPETKLELDGETYLGMLTIPALGLELPIQSEWSDYKLKLTPCRYAGTAGEENLVIAGHNYRTHFAALDRLPEGSEVLLETTDGDVLYYQVAEKEVLPPTAIEDMTAGELPLTLFTCTYGGRSRLAVRCAWAA